MTYHFDTWNVDADAADLVLLWQGTKLHGIGFLESWGYTQDDWLLTLFPITAAICETIGPFPFSILGLGWVIFAANIVLTAALTWRLSPTAGLLIIPALLLMGHDALGWAGFLSYPISHNGSVVWGFVAVLAAAYWIRHGAIAALLISAAAQIADVLSDPWSAVAFALPILFASLGVAILQSRSRLRLALCSAVSLLALLCLWTQAFGYLSFLPPADFEFTDSNGLVTNLAWLSRSLQTIWSPFPGVDQPDPLAGLLVISMMSACIVCTWKTAGKWLQRMHPDQHFIILAGTLSCLLPVIAFLSGNFLLALSIGRFVVPLSILAPAFLLVGLCRSWALLSVWSRLLVAAFIAMMIVSGVASRPEAWERFRIGPKADGVTAIVKFLAAHSLTYGYGPYWGIEANAVSWISRDAYRIRPVNFTPNGGIVRRYGQTSPSWYQRGDAPAGTRRFFVAVVGDGENCPEPDRCVRGVESEFGKADETLVLDDPGLRFGPITFLVWHRPPPDAL
ncbi:MAG: hypothetical protein JO264_03005 [Acidisphaera sp.]|nr:hypothetical protein [Acidisphaera sp.]